MTREVSESSHAKSESISPLYCCDCSLQLLQAAEPMHWLQGHALQLARCSNLAEQCSAV